jgi:deoxyhypusine synthase
MLRGRTVIFLGLAGAMVPAGMRNILVYLIKNRLIDCLVSTGANLFHDIHETLGRPHFQGTHLADDVALQKKGIDRIYDVYADEVEFIKTDNFISDWARDVAWEKPVTTREFFQKLGGYLLKRKKKDGIVSSAAASGVPIFCPAIADSCIGISMAYNRSIGWPSPQIDVIRDVLETAFMVSGEFSTGVIYLGGGTPKNFIQQTEVTATIIKNRTAGHDYAIQITADAPHWGGLSGCTLEEAQSWGKISAEAKKVSVFADTTIALPILVHGLAGKVGTDPVKRKKIPNFVFNDAVEINWDH